VDNVKVTLELAKLVSEPRAKIFMDVAEVAVVMIGVRRNVLFVVLQSVSEV